MGRPRASTRGFAGMPSLPGLSARLPPASSTSEPRNLSRHWLAWWPPHWPTWSSHSPHAAPVIQPGRTRGCLRKDDRCLLQDERSRILQTHTDRPRKGRTPVTADQMAAEDICRMDAVTLAREIREKQVSPTEVVDAVLDRMNRLEPTLHAFCTPAPDQAHADAQRVEKALMSGEDVGALAGIPIGIKDLVC